MICVAVAWLAIRPLGLVRAFCLSGLCAVSGLVTAFLVAWYSYPDGLETETPGDQPKPAKQRPMRFWRVKTTILRRRHPNGATDEIFQQQAEGVD